MFARNLHFEHERMNNMKVKFLAGLLILSLSGCAGFMAYKEGTAITPEIEQSLVEGKTTLDDVKSMIGYPDEITHENGLTQYIYNYTEINHVAPNRNEKAVIEFSKQGKFQRIIHGSGTKDNNPLR